MFGAPHVFDGKVWARVFDGKMYTHDELIHVVHHVWLTVN